MLTRKLIFFLIFISVQIYPQVFWKVQKTPVNDTLMSIKAINKNVVWACGDHGTVIKTTNSGDTWQNVSIPYNNFINVCIDAIDSGTAWIASTNEKTGKDFRVYKTTDGGKNWQLQLRYQNTFGDAVKFYDRNHGIAIGDPDPPGSFVVFVTNDGGENWMRVDSSNVPQARAGENEFGVTGCLYLKGNNAWFGTGSTSRNFIPRVYKSTDKGKTWTASQPLQGLNGILVSIDFKDSNEGIAIDNLGGKWAVTYDGGKSWHTSEVDSTLWLRDIKFIPGTKTIIIAGGNSNSGYIFRKLNDNSSWEKIPLPYNAKRIRSISFISNKIGWITGNSGEVLKWTGGNIAAKRLIPHK